MTNLHPSAVVIEPEGPEQVAVVGGHPIGVVPDDLGAGAFDDAGYTPRIAAEAGELSSLVELVPEGLGVAIIPRATADGANFAVLEIAARARAPRGARLERGRCFTCRPRVFWRSFSAAQYRSSGSAGSAAGPPDQSEARAGALQRIL